MSAAVRLIRRTMTPWITLVALLLFIPTSQCSTPDVTPFSLINKATGFCLIKKSTRCLELRWTTGNRLYTVTTKKCLGVQGKSLGSEVSLYDCNNTTDLQKWECRNGTLLALQGHELYIELKADETIALSKTVGPNNHFTIPGTSSGACKRTFRELYTIQGNAFGKICMFPFLYKDRWFGDCTTYDSPERRSWCAVETRYEHGMWGYCPTNSRDNWVKNPVTGANFQLNTQSVLTWSQAEVSCKQQGTSLLSITDPHEQAYISAQLQEGKHKLWIGLVLDSEHGWQWSDGKPYRYLRWSTGNPLPNPGHNCAFLDSAGLQSWQSSSCDKRLGYICYIDGAPPAPPQIEQGFCPSPWIPYNGHCFHLLRTPQTWTKAQRECRKEHGDLVSIHNVEDQSFVISQLGYASTDELWIGLNDRTTEGLFDWSDHSSVSFTSWEYGKPAVATDAEDCVLIRGENGNWADRSCDEKHGFICMRQSDTEQTGKEEDLDMGCKSGWKRHGSYCYFVGTETKTFDDAKGICNSSDSYLADVSNGVDNSFLVSLVGMRPEKYFWLGLSNQKNIDEFVWTNTKSVRFTHWNAEMPGSQQGCVAMTTGVFAGLWDVLPCTNKEKYICKHLAEGAVLTPVPPTQPPLKCAEGWNLVGTRHVCAKFFTGPRANEKTWFEARDYCRAIGGDLLSIHSHTEQQPIRYGRAWIGLHIPDPSSGYVWSDGSPVNFQHWQEGEPNNLNNAESCAELNSRDESGYWNDLHCESYNDWLCQIRAGVTPKMPPNATASDFNTTSDGWLEWRGNQYFIHSTNLPMDNARQFCKQRHADLVSITSIDENTFLWKKISRNYGHYYIGMQVDLAASQWWMDGTELLMQRWDENQPNTEAFDESCVTMTYYMGFWRTCNCGKEHKSICKRRSSPPTNTTAAPTVPPKGGCPSRWKKFDSKCYTFISEPKIIWNESRTKCNDMGGNLVSIPTRRIQVFLTTNMADTGNTDLWIGLNSIHQDEFYWVDGKPRRYKNWGNSQNRRRPGGFFRRWNENHCVVMNSNPVPGTGKWFIRPCNDTNGYICLRDLDPNIQTQPEPTNPSNYLTMGNDSIKAVTQNLTWDDAKKHCDGDKAHLASLRNEWIRAYVELLALKLKAPLWIGLKKQQTGVYFRYIDDWPMNSASWAEGEPSRNLPCVYLDVDGKWRTALCNQTMNSVCLKSSDQPPTQPTNFPGVCPEDWSSEFNQIYSWLPFKGHCYLFITDETEWPNAADSCVKHGGVLASIEDPSEQKFIESYLGILKDSHTSFWIGLYQTHKGTWLWLDRTALDYTNWDENEPYSDYGAIGTMYGKWRSGRKWHDRPYICKTSKVIPKDSELQREPHGSQNLRTRVHTSLVVVLVITVISVLIVMAFLLYKKSPHPLPTFENPLYFGSERSKPDVVDTNKLIENAEDPEPIISL